MLVVRKPDQSLATEWYAKPIASGRMLNYKSFHQLRHKVNVVNNFIHRVVSLSTNTTIDVSKQIILKQLQSNGYPKTLVNRLLQKYLSSRNHHIPSTTTTNTSNQPNVVLDRNDTSSILKPMYMPIPYVHKLTERLTKLFAQEYSTVRIAARQTTTVGNLHSRVKDPTATLEKNNIVYKIPCNQCNKCYIGKSKNRLGTRLTGHRSDINKLEQAIARNPNIDELDSTITDKTALIEHCVESGHRFNLENTSILDHTFHTNTLTFLEMCHIYTTPNTVNRRRDVDGLNVAYASVLHSTSTHTNNSQDNSQNDPSPSDIVPTQQNDPVDNQFQN